MKKIVRIVDDFNKGLSTAQETLDKLMENTDKKLEHIPFTDVLEKIIGKENFDKLKIGVNNGSENLQNRRESR